MSVLAGIIKFLLLNICRKGSRERNKVKVAIVGTGASGKAFFYSAERLAKVKYVFSRHRGDAFVYRYCKTKVVDDYDIILRDPEISAVIICNSNNLHFEFARRSLESGKNVLIEKPICLTLEECDKLKAIADAKNLIIGGILQYRFLKVLQKAKSLIDAGAFGDILSINGKVLWRRSDDYFQYGRGTKEADGGGVLIKQAIHCLDCMAYLGGGLKDARAFAFNVRKNIDIEDTAAVLLKYDKGAGSLFATICNSKDTPFSINIIGTRGGLSFDQNNKIRRWTSSGVQKWFWNLSMLLPPNLVYLQTRDFLNCLKSGQPLKVDFQTARRCLSDVLLIYKNMDYDTDR